MIAQCVPCVCVAMHLCSNAYMHQLHNAFLESTKATEWNLEGTLEALRSFFKDCPARREDFVKCTGSSIFPLKFCSTQLVDNVRVVKRAIEVWPNVRVYVKAVQEKKYPNPKNKSFGTIKDGFRDPLVIAKLQFYLCVANIINPFLVKYQTEDPVLPFLASDLEAVMCSLMEKFVIKSELTTAKSEKKLCSLT